MQHSIDLYATPTELGEWLAHVHGRFPIHFAFVRFFPFSLEPLPNGWTPLALPTADKSVRELWMDLSPIDSSGMDHSGGASCNRHRLALQIPETRPEGLRVGSLGTLTDDPTHLKIWRAALRYFRTQTTAGMWVASPDRQNKAFYRHLRYSNGIAELCRSGLQLIPVAGWNLVFIQDPGTA